MQSGCLQNAPECGGIASLAVCYDANDHSGCLISDINTDLNRQLLTVLNAAIAQIFPDIDHVNLLKAFKTVWDYVDGKPLILGEGQIGITERVPRDAKTYPLNSIFYECIIVLWHDETDSVNPFKVTARFCGEYTHDTFYFSRTGFIKGGLKKLRDLLVKSGGHRIKREDEPVRTRVSIFIMSVIQDVLEMDDDALEALARVEYDRSLEMLLQVFGETDVDSSRPTKRAKICE